MGTLEYEAEAEGSWVGNLQLAGGSRQQVMMVLKWTPLGSRRPRGYEELKVKSI